ncbi:MAG: DUF2306 domain-containing protein [Aureispira sp.]|nr:DUF2306 domain-containing protein [Aureispira sp.]
MEFKIGFDNSFLNNFRENTSTLQRFKQILIYIIVAIFSSFTILMAAMILHSRLDFFDLSQPHQFLFGKEKYFYIYLPALYGHLLTSSFILILGLFSMFKFIRNRWMNLHRWIGRIYVLLTLIISAPCGFIMALYAMHSLNIQICFALLALAWWWTTWKGYRNIRAGDIIKHQHWMLRSFALAFSAISLRLYTFLLIEFADYSHYDAYLISSWNSWIGNLILVEIYWTISRTSIPKRA